MPMPDEVNPIERQLVRDRAYGTLRGWIVEGILKPNEKMRDAELALRLGVSRTPIREALRRLEDEGLVQTAPNRWTRVSPLDVGDGKRLYPIIAALECLAVRSGGSLLDSQDLQELIGANERLARGLKKKNPVEASDADHDFHRVLVHHVENPELLKILEELKVKLRRLETAYFRGSVVADRSVREHEQILAALKKKDIENAAKAVDDNWRNGLDRLMRQMSKISDKTID
jgi:DNA-binding GntR family transcriptional regulator